MASFVNDPPGRPRPRPAKVPLPCPAATATTTVPLPKAGATQGKMIQGGLASRRGPRPWAKDDPALWRAATVVAHGALPRPGGPVASDSRPLLEQIRQGAGAGLHRALIAPGPRIVTRAGSRARS